MIADGTWRIEPGASSIRLLARVLRLPVRCRLDVASGVAQIADGGRTGRIAAVIDATTFDSGNARRDEHVKSVDFLDAGEHPSISFEAAWIELPTVPAVLTGDLQVAGRTRPVEVTVEIEHVTEESVTFHLTSRVSRRAFGVTRARGVLGDVLDLDLHGVARRVPSEDAGVAASAEAPLSRRGA